MLEHEISAPPHVVFEFFTDPALLIEWLGIAAELDPQPEGIFQFEVAPGEHCRGRYLEIDPPRRVVFTWGWDNPAMSVPPGWGRYLQRLMATVLGGEVGPDPASRTPEEMIEKLRRQR